MAQKISVNQTVRYTIKISGKEFSQQDAKGLEVVSVEDHVDMIGVAEFTFGDENNEWASFKIGDDVEVVLGGDKFKVFVGHIVGFRHQFQKGHGTLTVIANDPLCKMAASRRVKVYEEMKDSDCVSSIIGEAGCSSGTVDPTSGTFKYILQRNESDLAFARRLAGRNGYLLMANEGKIDFKKPQFSGKAVDLPKEKIVALDYTVTDQHIPPDLTVYGWDYVKKEMVKGEAKKGDVVAIGGGDNAVARTGKIWAASSYVSDVLVTSNDGAKSMAVGEINRLARNFLRGRAILQGDGSMHAGIKVAFKEHAEGFNPEGYVVSSKHLIEANGGFTTEIRFCGNTYPV